MEDLPVEQTELLDIDFDLLEQQQFGSQQLDDTARESWADQQDQPEGLNPNVDLIDLGGDGAASGAPIAVDPEPVVEGPPNYNIFHGESPPPPYRDQRGRDWKWSCAQRSGDPTGFCEEGKNKLKKLHRLIPLERSITIQTILNSTKLHLVKVPLRAHRQVLLGKTSSRRFVDVAHGAEGTKRKSLSRDNFTKSVFHQPIAG